MNIKIEQFDGIKDTIQGGVTAFEIIDFHTHPFSGPETNICAHQEFCNMSVGETLNVFRELGVSKICGSVISERTPENRNNWNEIKKNNDTALELKNVYGDFYIPGFHIHPSYPEESIKEIERMDKLGIRMFYLWRHIRVNTETL